MDECIKSWIEESLKRLFTSTDRTLIDRKLKEECINHRLAFHLEICKPLSYKDYYIDLEYDKKGEVGKCLPINGEQQFIRPDILIHLRDDDITDNLIAFECKKDYLNRHDKDKLRGLLGNEYDYTICIGISYQPEKEYFLLYRQENQFNRPLRVKKSECIIS